MFHWDPRPEIFTIPYLNWPILWYGIFFALGFAVGFPIFVSILRRFFLHRPDYTESDILRPEELTVWGRTKSSIANALNERIAQEEIGEVSPSLAKLVEKSRCLHPKRALARLSFDHRLGGAVLGVQRKAVSLTDRLTLYMVVGTVAGARLGHFLFYERPSDYFQDPLEIFRIWEGGLASHGAALGIILALILFSYRIRGTSQGLSWVRLLDFVSIPTAFAGCCIRIGNFFNQEILGTPTNLPWAVIFGHPADHSFPAPRHPAQLYEALFYLLIFFFLWRLSYTPRFLLPRGKLVGLFLTLVFGFRFLVEFLKVEQSHLLSMAPALVTPVTPVALTMGQILSIPAIVLGLVFYFWRR